MSLRRRLSDLALAVMLGLSLALGGGLIGSGAPAWALDPSERLDDPRLEERAREISKGLRCVVCKNQSIDDSEAEMAGDLRRTVRERLVAGDSDGQVVDYIVSRYGDFVLLKPPMRPETYPLWYGPAAIFLLGLIGLGIYYREKKKSAVKTSPSPLSEDEQRRLNGLLADQEASGRNA